MKAAQHFLRSRAHQGEGWRQTKKAPPAKASRGRGFFPSSYPTTSANYAALLTAGCTGATGDGAVAVGVADVTRTGCAAPPREKTRLAARHAVRKASSDANCLRMRASSCFTPSRPAARLASMRLV